VKDSALYIKLVEWSDEDQCFIGQCPGIIGPCCHGDDEAQVYAELCQIVEEWIALMKQEGKPLPAPTMGKNVAAKLLDSASQGITQ
jgi:predicted RNase H-like HicB family nuclease